MTKIEEINSEIYKSDSTEFPDNYVAVAVELTDKGDANHSGLIICANGKRKLFHFAISDEIKLEDIPEGKLIFHKHLTIIKPGEAKAFLLRCEMIADKGNPRFGFFYDGSYYDESGKFVSKNNTGEFTNCVLFCINVILGFIESDAYILFNEWTADQLAEGFFLHFSKKNGLFMEEEELNKLRNILIRIPPIDYTATAFKVQSPILPIRKEDIKEIVPHLKQVLASKVVK